MAIIYSTFLPDKAKHSKLGKIEFYWFNLKGAHMRTYQKRAIVLSSFPFPLHAFVMLCVSVIIMALVVIL
jgi:hypothetical protein